MAQNNSSLATADLRAYLDQALESPRGIKIKVGHPGQATKLRQRFYSFRLHDRKENRKIYNAEHPMHGKSIYDGLVAEVVGDDIMLTKTETKFTVEEL